MQAAVRQATQRCTVLAIAHRLRSIIDYDRVLVLGPQGRVLEYAPPAEVLADADSALAQLARESGDYDELVALARGS